LIFRGNDVHLLYYRQRSIYISIAWSGTYKGGKIVIVIGQKSWWGIIYDWHWSGNWKWFWLILPLEWPGCPCIGVFGISIADWIRMKTVIVVKIGAGNYGLLSSKLCVTFIKTIIIYRSLIRNRMSFWEPPCRPDRILSLIKVALHSLVFARLFIPTFV
jgi:hypothetical protein